MSRATPEDLSDFSMSELFRLEVETQAHILSAGLVDLEIAPDTAALLKELMRAAHSLKGAARIVNYEPGVLIAHAMEDCFVAAQKGEIAITPKRTDDLLGGVDLLMAISKVGEERIAAWGIEHGAEVAACVARLESGDEAAPPAPDPDIPIEQPAPSSEAPPLRDTAKDLSPSEPPPAAPSAAPDTSIRGLRITADNLNRLLGLAGESLLSSRWLETFAMDLQRLKTRQGELLSALDNQRQSEMSARTGPSGDMEVALAEIRRRTDECHVFLLDKIQEFDHFKRTFTDVAHRLYHEVLDSRMRPFGDAVHGFRRMVRDMARELGKEVRFDIQGMGTSVDREILERLEAPLGHMLRNALDHGLESPDRRAAAGKAREGTLGVEARHSAGFLLVQVSDDGAGVDLADLRRAVVEKELTTFEIANELTEAELLEFLFLPGFTTKGAVTEISGRGVGLDAVQIMAREVGGSIRVATRAGRGTQFQLVLPITLSVLRTLIVEIAGEPYAFPLARIHSATKSPAARIESVGGRQHFLHHGQHVGLVLARQVLGLEPNPEPVVEFPVVVLDDGGQLYGLVVDSFLDERELVILPLDPRLGKVPNIASAAVLPDRSPVLIFETEDLIRSMQNLASGERLQGVATGESAGLVEAHNRILVVDDSLTVRELERKLLTGAGYVVDIAVDGMDGWNAARVGRYDLIVTDVDMPRMDGIELISLVRGDPRLKSTPVIIVSYKDRAEDRQRGLEAGADHYLTKSSFQDESFTRAVRDLIGEPPE